MKLLKRHIEKDGSGSVALRLEQDEDLWHGEVAEMLKPMHTPRLGLIRTIFAILVESIQSDTGGGVYSMR